MIIMADHCYNSVEVTEEMDFEDSDCLDAESRAYLENMNELLANIDNLGVLKNVLQAYDQVYTDNTPWGIEFTLQDCGSSFTISIRKLKNDQTQKEEQCSSFHYNEVQTEWPNFDSSSSPCLESIVFGKNAESDNKHNLEANKTDLHSIKIPRDKDERNEDNLFYERADNHAQKDERKKKDLTESYSDAIGTMSDFNLPDSEIDSEVDLDKTVDSSDDTGILRSLLTPKTYIKHYDDNNFRTNQRVLECEYCFYKSPRKYRIKEHIATKHPEVLLGETVNSKKSSPVKTQHKRIIRKNIKKPSTQKKTLALTKLKNEVKSKNNWLEEFLKSINCKNEEKPTKRTNCTRVFNCSFCTFICNDQTELYRHIGLNHTGDNNVNIDCMICDFKGEDRRSYLAHLRSCHPGKKTYECKKCDYKTESVRYYHRHIKEIHQNIGTFQCKHCEFTATRISTLNKHCLFKHKKVWPYVCAEDGCAYHTSAESNFQAHIMEVHKGIRPLLCCEEGCNFATSRNYVLKRHQFKVHGIGSPPQSQVKKRLRGEFQCPNCPKTCSQKVNLQNHIRVHHLGLKNHYQCGECDFSAAIKNIVDIHIREIHKGYYPYKCEQCDYKTSVKQRFENHFSAVHLKERPFKCPHCDHRASQRTHIRRHIRDIHLREKPNLCVYCKFCTANRGNLKAHLKNVHKVNDEHIKEVLQTCINLRKDSQKQMTLRKIIVNSDNVRDDETLKASQILVHIGEEVDGTVIFDDTVYTVQG